MEASAMVTCTDVTAEVGRRYDVCLARKCAVVVGRSAILGRPGCSFTPVPSGVGPMAMPSCSRRPWKPPRTSSEHGTVPAGRSRLPRTGSVQAGWP